MPPFILQKKQTRSRVLFVRSAGAKGNHNAISGKLRTNKENGEKRAEMITNPLPAWLRPDPAVEESFQTESSDLQDATSEECLPHLLAQSDNGLLRSSALPDLERGKHATFLRKLLGRLPKQFAALDASRPWMLYWCLNGLSILGEDVSSYRESVITTLRPLQNSTGGFSGGHGQYSHLATTYAAVLSLVTVGGEALDLVDRRAMWQWLGALKQAEGDFEVCVGGERDVRGAYCAMVILSLLNLPTELPQSSPARQYGHTQFHDGLIEWIGKCQTYEGGLSSAPGSEAHGAYTFCALACLCIIDQPQVALKKALNIPALVSWLAARQHAPEGGLAGRTNKLVDGCYSHWIGGCWSLTEAALADGATLDKGATWNREGLLRYILCCCQAEKGGLRDKPSKGPDAYHTCYNLAGLSSTQHYYIYESTTDVKSQTPLTAAFRWTASKKRFQLDASSTGIIDDGEGNGDESMVSLIHPVYVIAWGAAEGARAHFEKYPGFRQPAQS